MRYNSLMGLDQAPTQEGFKPWRVEIPSATDKKLFASIDLKNPSKRVGEELPASVYIEDEGRNVLLDFGTLLNPPVSFIVDYDHQYNYELRTVMVSSSIKSPRELLIVLHEMGHIKVYDEDTDLKTQVEQFPFGTPVPPGLPDPVLTMERRVWAQAIQWAREMKKTSGVDLFKLFQNNDELMGWLRMAGLRTYESRGVVEGTGTFTKDAQVEAFLRAAKDSLGDEVKSGIDILRKSETETGKKMLPDF